MKRITKLLPLLILTLPLASCSKYLDKPTDTNLEHWITEEYTEDSFKDCTHLTIYMGGYRYLDSRYVAIYDEDTNIYDEPDIAVVYYVTGYPDYSDDKNCVTQITITDPEIYVYGLTLNSTSDEIDSTMKNNGFKFKNDAWRKNNCSFRFYESSIRIDADVSNREHLVY